MMWDKKCNWESLWLLIPQIPVAHAQLMLRVNGFALAYHEYAACLELGNEKGINIFKPLAVELFSYNTPPLL